MSALLGPGHVSDAALLMDRIYGHQRHIYDATRKFYLLGRDELIAGLDPAPGARILEIGCGTGRNLIQIARRYPRARCHGLDVSTAMLATARKSIRRAGLAARIDVAEADATAFDPLALFGVATFDRVVVSYALSMIPPWRDVLAQAVDVLAGGGSLHVVDFGDQARLPTAFKRVLKAWLTLFQVTPRETLVEELAGLARTRGLSCRSRALFRGYALSVQIGR